MPSVVIVVVQPWLEGLAALVVGTDPLHEGAASLIRQTDITVSHEDLPVLDCLHSNFTIPEDLHSINNLSPTPLPSTTRPLPLHRYIWRIPPHHPTAPHRRHHARPGTDRVATSQSRSALPPRALLVSRGLPQAPVPRWKRSGRTASLRRFGLETCAPPPDEVRKRAQRRQSQLADALHQVSVLRVARLRVLCGALLELCVEVVLLSRALTPTACISQRSLAARW